MNMSYWNNLTLEQRQKVKSYLYKIEKQKQIIEKAIEYIEENTKDMCYYGKCNEGDLLVEVEEDIKNDLLNILNGRSDE